MPEYKSRLEDTSKQCVDAYTTWSDDKKDSKKREALQDAIHDLRKVTSRLEIEIAIAERGNVSDNPIPIPTHRSQSKAKGGTESILPDRSDEGNDKNDGKRRPRQRKQTGKKDS